MSNPYKKDWEKVSAPDRLIRETEYRMQQPDPAPKRHIGFYSAAASLVVVCLAVFTVFHFAEPEEMHLEAGRSYAQTAPSGSSAIGDSIRINRIDQLNKEPWRMHGPMVSDIRTWTLAEYIEALGTDPRPAFLPDGFTRQEPESGEVAFQQDSRCDFYNTWSFSYEAQDGRKITVFVNPSFIPYWSSARSYQLTDDMKPENLLDLGEDSLISGNRVKLWHLERGEGWDYGMNQCRELKNYYCADFWYNGAGFTVTAENGVTQEELVKVIKSIMK